MDIYPFFEPKEPKLIRPDFIQASGQVTEGQKSCGIPIDNQLNSDYPHRNDTLHYLLQVHPMDIENHS